MNLYFDMEFTGLHKDTTLISVGIISDNGKKFYAEFTDYAQDQINPWIDENVIKNLLFDNGNFVRKSEHEKNGIEMRTTKINVSGQLKTWLNQFDSVQFVSDVCHYDFVLLIDLFGTAFDLPNNVSPVCYDINHDIAEYYLLSDKQAFDYSREKIIAQHGIFIDGTKHNALYDVKVIREIYGVMHK